MASYFGEVGSHTPSITDVRKGALCSLFALNNLKRISSLKMTHPARPDFVIPTYVHMPI